MKNLFLILFVFAIYSCNQSDNSEVLKLQAEKDSLLMQSEMKDKTINDFFNSLNDIEDNLKQIKEKENIVTILSSQQSEDSSDVHNKINEDIQLIYQMMLENKEALRMMKKKMKQANLKIVEFEKMIANLTKELKNKDAEISTLKDRLVAMNIEITELNIEVDTLKGTIEKKEQVITEKIDEINTAYYVYGTRKELEKQQVVTKDGGFIGLGKIEKLKDDFNRDYFEKIDIRKVKRLKLFCAKAKLITTHPANSYKIYGQNRVDSLVITNPNQFWSVSKYLVVVVE